MAAPLGQEDPEPVGERAEVPRETAGIGKPAVRQHDRIAVAALVVPGADAVEVDVVSRDSPSRCRCFAVTSQYDEAAGDSSVSHRASHAWSYLRRTEKPLQLSESTSPLSDVASSVIGLVTSRSTIT